jgi:hypothetical protein
MLLSHGRSMLTENVQNERDLSGQSLIGNLELLKRLPKSVVRVLRILSLTSIMRHEGQREKVYGWSLLKRIETNPNFPLLNCRILLN